MPNPLRCTLQRGVPAACRAAEQQPNLQRTRPADVVQQALKRHLPAPACRKKGVVLPAKAWYIPHEQRAQYALIIKEYTLNYSVGALILRFKV